MKKKSVLITGSNGEIGQSLVRWYHVHEPETSIIALDLTAPREELRPYITHVLSADITHQASYEQVVRAYDVDTIFHLAALLSTRAEQVPALAHHVNVEGTFNLLTVAASLGEQNGYPTKMIFPSSIAVYGLRNKAEHLSTYVQESQFLSPITMYGLNKLYCEDMGTYYAEYYGQTWTNPPTRVDFRCVRFPGIISADTVPNGGTSDYGPEMIHAAAQNKPYAAFVRPDSIIPFMVMPDAVQALIQLANAPVERLSRRVYNVTSFSLTAEDIAAIVRAYFPQANIRFEPQISRQRIVDSWPAVLDDMPARQDWGWQPHYDAQSSFSEYLLPAIASRYGIAPKR